VTVTEDTAVEKACRVIQKRGIKRLPVVRDVARADLVRALGLVSQ
jgi:CBS domain-containing protein